MKAAFAALAAGLVFGFGLVIAGMTDPRNVLAFLDLAGGAWDPRLAFVLGGAVGVGALAFHFILRRPAPWLADRFHLPRIQTIDARLVAGAAIFGVGWGVSGYCPGPAIASLALGNPEAWIFVPALLAGAALHRWHGRSPVSIGATEAVAYENTE